MSAAPEAAAAETLVELVGVSRAFDSVQAVRDVSLAIRRGEFFSLLGPSGCGKTTTLRMIGGFVDPSAGDILIEGRRMNDLPPERRPTNMVFQQLALFPHLTVFENIAFGLRLKRRPADEIRRRVGAALALVDLGGYSARYPSQISGGQQQRVAIARALVNEPAVLLLDEPLGALDLRLRVQMQAELKAIQARIGTTFIFVTHDQGEAFAMSDRIALMREGRVEQVGAPRDLYERPASRFAAEFVGDTNLIAARVSAVADGTVAIEGEGLTVAGIPGRAAAGEAVTVSIRPENVAVSAGGAPGAAPATVASVVFQGATAKIGLALASGRALQAMAIDSDFVRGLAPGAAVSIAVDPRRAVVLQR